MSPNLPARTRRLAAAAVVLLVGAGPLLIAPPTRAERPQDRVIAQGAALAAAAVAIGNVDPDVDVWPLYSQSSIDNQTSHGLSGAIWPGFLLDAFAWLYGLQPQERAGLGISESQWPNPPHSSHASSSDFMIRSLGEGCASFFDPASCAQALAAFSDPPVALGISESHSGELISFGMARGARFDFPGIVETAEGWSRTNARYDGTRTIVESVFTARDVKIGTDLHIDLIEARSTAAAGGRDGRSDGSSTLRIVGARLGDTPVVIDSQGLHTAGDEGTDDLNEALATQGLEIRASQGRQDEDPSGEFVDTSTGGLLVRVLKERVEESFPEPVVAGKEAACGAAEENALNEEITRIRVDQPNPLYAQIPITPERLQVEQSVPPPVGCPFLNRNFEVTIALGLTNASARLSPLPGFSDLPPVLVAPTSGEGSSARSVQRSGAPSATTPGSRPTAVGADDTTDLVGAPVTDGDTARRVRIFYGFVVLLAAVGIAGRFALRAISAP